MLQLNYLDELTEEMNNEEVSLAEKVAEYVLCKEGCPYDCEINLTITNNEGIRERNSEFRGIDNATDVLSFPNCEFDLPGVFEQFVDETLYFDCFNPENGNLFLGDIMISRERMQEQAEEFGHGTTREFAFLIAHSVLHLIGYDHMEEEEAARMESKQNKYLNDLGITRQ